jgi:hypothetical protein
MGTTWHSALCWELSIFGDTSHIGYLSGFISKTIQVALLVSGAVC